MNEVIWSANEDMFVIKRKIIINTIYNDLKLKKETII